MSLMEIRAKCRRLKQQHDLKLVVIDYLQLMSSGKRVESRQQEVSEFSRALKLLAKELEVPVIAISQLNRGAEQRTDKRPQMSDLRESGSIEQDADIVILLHREDAYEKESPRAGEADVIVAKHRNGPTGHARRGVPGALLALRGHAGLTLVACRRFAERDHTLWRCSAGRCGWGPPAEPLLGVVCLEPLDLDEPQPRCQAHRRPVRGLGGEYDGFAGQCAGEPAECGFAGLGGVSPSPCLREKEVPKVHVAGRLANLVVDVPAFELDDPDHCSVEVDHEMTGTPLRSRW